MRTFDVHEAALHASGSSGGQAHAASEGAARLLPTLDADHVDTLYDLVRWNREVEFKELAACLGISTSELDAMWRGARLLFPE